MLVTDALYCYYFSVSIKDEGKCTWTTLDISRIL